MSYLVDKRVFITGASSGIGAYLARELHRRGARVGLLARRQERLQELARELEPDGGDRVAWVVADVTDGEALKRALDELEATLGGVDIVIANAGYGRTESPHHFEPGGALEMYDTNLFGMLRVIDWALPRFLGKRSGHLVGIASVASYVGIADSASYCGSKAAMRVHLQSLRLSLRRYGIAVTTICPGYVESELTAEVGYEMPFLLETSRAASTIAQAIAKQKSEVIFPWQMKMIVLLCLRFLPRVWLEALLGRFSPGPQDRDPIDTRQAMA